jgi:hypothetical protein
MPSTTPGMWCRSGERAGKPYRVKYIQATHPPTTTTTNANKPSAKAADRDRTDARFGGFPYLPRATSFEYPTSTAIETPTSAPPIQRGPPIAIVAAAIAQQTPTIALTFRPAFRFASSAISELYHGGA